MTGTGRCAPERKPYVQKLRVLAVALLASITAACKHDAGPMASASGAANATVAFESIDGPPIGIFNRLVQNLNEEADARQVAVVSREGPAQYRVRGYLAAHVERNQTVIAWVWDVYDSDQRRALRITGEEPAPGAHNVRNAWAAADERVLRRIAQTGFDNLVRFLGTPSTAIAFGNEAPATTVRTARPDAGSVPVQPRPTQAAVPTPASTMAFTIE
jgi:hypothetical protein